jgi:hypothetical protein
VNGCSDPVLASRTAVSFPAIPSWPGTHISWTLLCLASFMRDWWQSQTSFEVIWCWPSALIVTWLSDRIWDVSIHIVTIYILDWSCLDGIYFCLEYCCVLPKAETKFPPVETVIKR